jgi:hypothetical protein
MQKNSRPSPGVSSQERQQVEKSQNRRRLLRQCKWQERCHDLIIFTSTCRCMSFGGAASSRRANGTNASASAIGTCAAVVVTIAEG